MNSVFFPKWLIEAGLREGYLDRRKGQVWYGERMVIEIQPLDLKLQQSNERLNAPKKS